MNASDLINMGTATALVLALTEAIKRLVWWFGDIELAGRMLPAVALLAALIVVGLVGLGRYVSTELADSILLVIVVWLSAMGLWSGGKAAVGR